MKPIHGTNAPLLALLAGHVHVLASVSPNQAIETIHQLSSGILDRPLDPTYISSKKEAMSLNRIMSRAFPKFSSPKSETPPTTPTTSNGGSLTGSGSHTGSRHIGEDPEDEQCPSQPRKSAASGEDPQLPDGSSAASTGKVSTPTATRARNETATSTSIVYIIPTTSSSVPLTAAATSGADIPSLRESREFIFSISVVYMMSAYTYLGLCI